MNFAQLKGERLLRGDRSWLPFDPPLMGMFEGLQVENYFRHVPLRFDCGHAREGANLFYKLVAGGERVELCRRCHVLGLRKLRKARFAELGVPTMTLRERLQVVFMSMLPASKMALYDDWIGCSKKVIFDAVRLLEVERKIARVPHKRGNNEPVLYRLRDGVEPPSPALVAVAREEIVRYRGIKSWSVAKKFAWE